MWTDPSSYLYTSGVHGIYEQSGLVYDLNTNKKLELTDILNGTESEIKQLFIDGALKMIDKEPERYFENAKETISNYKDEINFYLSNSELVFFFNSYNIALYAGGSPSFSIPFKGNENLFNKRIITNNN